MADQRGEPGSLIAGLLDVVDAPGPQLRAVATTLLIKAVDVPTEEGSLLEDVVASDPAGVMIDALGAERARRRLRARLSTRLEELAAAHGEDTAVGAMRDHLLAQVDRWAARAVDDAANRRRAERFLAWAERPEQLDAAQRRGMFAGMDREEVRRLADDQVRRPVTPELAVEVWEQVDAWKVAVDQRIGEAAMGAWRSAGGSGRR